MLDGKDLLQPLQAEAEEINPDLITQYLTTDRLVGKDLGEDYWDKRRELWRIIRKRN